MYGKGRTYDNQKVVLETYRFCSVDCARRNHFNRCLDRARHRSRNVLQFQSSQVPNRCLQGVTQPEKDPQIGGGVGGQPRLALEVTSPA
jgi:hypothetical protein